MPSLLFMFQCLLLCICVYSVSRRVLAGRERWRQGLGAMVFLYAVTYANIMPLAATSNLTSANALIGLAVLSGAAAWICKGKTIVRSSRHSFVPSSNDIQGFGSLVLVLAITCAHSLNRMTRGTPFGSDDLNYGASFVGHLIANKGLSWLPNTYQIHYPFNTEILSTWLMMSSGDDRFVYVASVFWFLLATLSVVSIGLALIQRRPDRGLAFLSGALFAASPVVWYQASSFAPVDLATAAVMLAAVALATPSRSSGSRCAHSLSDSAIVGVATGLAIGGKITALPVVAVLWVYMVGFRSRRPDGTFIKLNIAALVVPVIFFGTFWYIRNWVATGNPLFPQRSRSFLGHSTTTPRREPVLPGGWPKDSQIRRNGGFSWQDTWTGRFRWPRAPC